MYYAIQSRDPGFIEWVTEAASPEAALENFDLVVGIDPHGEGLDALMDRFDITEISRKDAELLSQLSGDNPEAIEYLEALRP